MFYLEMIRSAVHWFMPSPTDLTVMLHVLRDIPAQA
jgi:hypothetical protein